MDKRVLAALILGVSIVGLSLGATVPMVALRLYQAGASSLYIGVMSALPAAGIMLSAFSVDWLCQRLSRRNIYLACFALSTLSIALLELPGLGAYLLGLARFAMGLAAGLVIILGESWVNEVAPDSHRGRVVAIYTTCFTVFQLFGPAMVALLGSAGPHVHTVVVVAHLLAIAVVLRTLPKPLIPHGEGARRTFSVLGFVRVAPALCMGILFFAFFDSVILSLFPVYAAEHGYAIKLAALMSTIILLGDAAFQLPLGWLADKVSRPALYLGCGVVALAIGVCLPWLMYYPLLLWPSLVVLGAVAGAVYTLAIILIGEGFSGPDLVTANASAGFLWGVGSLLGPLLSSAAMTISSYGLPIALTGAAALFVAIAWPLARKQVPAN